METISIALGLAILVMFVLLMSCWRPAKRSSCRAGKKEGMELSDSGTGVENRKMNKRYEDLMAVDDYDDYNEVVQYAALEPSIFESHNEYSKDINRSTSGASLGSVRSDDMNYVPWVGLRRPKYQDIEADGSSRQDISVYKDQLPESNYFCL
jgi:hypothetical protein